MRDLIFDGGKTQAAFEAGNDANVVVLLNTPTQRVKRRGLVSVAGLANDTSAELATKFLATMRVAIAQLAQGTELQRAQAILFESFLTRFVAATDGLDFQNDELRGYISAICGGAGWSAAEIEAVLSTGYVLQSRAVVRHGRDATADDVAQVRAEINAEQLRQDYDASFNAWVAAAMQAGDRAAVVKGLRTMADDLGA